MTRCASISRSAFAARLLVGGAMPLLLIAQADAQTAPESQSQENQSRAVADRGLAISLPSMNLERALKEIALREGVEILYDAATVRTKTSSPVDAQSTAQALQQALDKTGLSMMTDARGAYRVGEVDPGRPTDILVRARRNEAETGYGVQSVSSATRDGKSLRDQPQSTSIVTAKVLADQQVQTITESLRNVSGTTTTGAVGGPPNYTVRGFVATATTGGLSNPLGNQEPVANVERIEVLKGPSALLSGSANLGGIVNIVTKHPTVDTLLNVSAEYASFDERKLTVDGSTALDPERRFSARLVAQYDRAKRSFGGYDGRFENLVAPSIRYKAAGTDITLGGEYSDRRDPGQRFSAFVGGVLVDFPKSYGPDQAGIRTETRRAWLDASQKVAPWLTLSVRGQHNAGEQTVRINAPAGFIGTTTAVIGGSDTQQRTLTDAVDGYARVNVSTGPLEHTIVFGANFSRFRSDQIDPATLRGLAFQTNFLTSDALVKGFSIYTVKSSRNVTLQDGYYAQDTIDFGRLHLVAGVRRSKYTTDGVALAGPLAGLVVHQEDAKTTANFGGVFDVSSAISVYANYTSGFTPQFRNDNGAALPAQTAKNLEGGVKIDMFGGRLAFVGSAFRIRQSNTNYSVFDNVGNVSYVIIRGQETKGVEADLRGTILPGWQILASGTLTDTKLLDIQPFVTQIAGLPKRRASLFSSYEVQGGALKGLGLGAGVYYNSDSIPGFNAVAAKLRVPASTQVDLNGYYTIGKLRLNAGVSNLFDKKNYTTSTGTTYIIRKPGRTYRATLTYSFFK